MIRYTLWGFSGLLLGLIIHLTLILGLPKFQPNTVWTYISQLGEPGEVVTLGRLESGSENKLHLDPEMAYATCRFDLARGPGVLSGPLPDDFWSIGVFDVDGVAIYGTTNRSGVGKSLELGIFNSAQTRLLAEQQITLQEGLLIIESPQNQIFVVVRLAPPHPVMWDRYTKMLEQLRCGHLDQEDITSGIQVLD